MSILISSYEGIVLYHLFALCLLEWIERAIGVLGLNVENYNWQEDSILECL
jgi:hypothetical protein